LPTRLRVAAATTDRIPAGVSGAENPVAADRVHKIQQYLLIDGRLNVADANAVAYLGCT
jgi:hypothetical protein